MLLRRCSVPIWVALSFIDGNPMSIFFGPLYSLRGVVDEKANGEAHCSVEDAVYVYELSGSEDSEVCGMIFGFEKLFYYKGFVGWA